jgi:hypothetical protein
MQRDIQMKTRVAITCSKHLRLVANSEKKKLINFLVVGGALINCLSVNASAFAKFLWRSKSIKKEYMV